MIATGWHFQSGWSNTAVRIYRGAVGRISCTISWRTY